ncbi:MAG: hypothetical protein H7A34_07755 [bacterium]|nr:hypothetical protein [bacterium]
MRINTSTADVQTTTQHYVIPAKAGIYFLLLNSCAISLHVSFRRNTMRINTSTADVQTTTQHYVVPAKAGILFCIVKFMCNITAVFYVIPAKHTKRINTSTADVQTTTQHYVIPAKAGIYFVLLNSCAIPLHVSFRRNTPRG